MEKSSFSRSAFSNPRVLKSSINHALWRCGIARSLAAASTLVFLLLMSAAAVGASATWLLNPPNNVWNGWSDPMNWMPATIPNGLSDTARFDQLELRKPVRQTALNNR